MKHEPELTHEQLQLAFRHLRRPGWPTLLEDVMADPLRAPLVRGLARQMARSVWGSRDTRHALAQPMPPMPATPTPRKSAAKPRPTQMRLPHLTFDPRRAAANDKDDRNA